jgi:hypothetical protein
LLLKILNPPVQAIRTGYGKRLLYRLLCTYLYYICSEYKQQDKAYFIPVKHCKSAIYPGIREETGKVQKFGYLKDKEVQIFRGSGVQKLIKMAGLSIFSADKNVVYLLMNERSISTNF